MGILILADFRSIRGMYRLFKGVDRFSNPGRGREAPTRPVYFYLFGRNRTGIVQIVLGKVRKFRAV